MRLPSSMNVTLATRVPTTRAVNGFDTQPLAANSRAAPLAIRSPSTA